jgi:hypothetical protein
MPRCSLLPTTLLVALASAKCNFFGQAATDYADANLSVVQLPPNATEPLASCCAACSTWNAAAPRNASATCRIGVLLHGTVCTLKPSSDRPFPSSPATAVQPSSALGPNPDMANLDLIILPWSLAERYGAKCLDGSPPAIYMKGANTSADPSAANKWVLFFKGGGWCYDETMCYTRSQGILGSSLQLNATQPKFGYGGGGPVGADALENPSFAHFNRVILWYCDGGSFTGDLTDPIVVNGSKVWFRGKRNLDAVLGYLREEHGFGAATDVLVSGGSAGGLSAYIHADHIRSTLLPPDAGHGATQETPLLSPSASTSTSASATRPTDTARNATTLKFRAAPVSGFFLNHRTMTGEAMHEADMRYVFTMMNSSGGVNRACAAAYSPVGEQWRCIFANESWSFSTTPTFPINSAIDAYQLSDILEFNGSRYCAGLNVGVPVVPGPQMSNCSTQELAVVRGYEHDFLHDIQSSSAFTRAGSGGFIESCVEHCLGMAAGWCAVSDPSSGVTMQQAVSAWWSAPDGDPAAAHWHLPCAIRSASPGQCNPSCSNS